MPLIVEKMTATSTTSPDQSNDSEEREIQNALDKKRKKRRYSLNDNNSQEDSLNKKLKAECKRN